MRIYVRTITNSKKLFSLLSSYPHTANVSKSLYEAIKDCMDNHTAFCQYMLFYITMSKSGNKECYNSYNYNYSDNSVFWVGNSHPPQQYTIIFILKRKCVTFCIIFNIVYEKSLSTITFKRL